MTGPAVPSDGEGIAAFLRDTGAAISREMAEEDLARRTGPHPAVPSDEELRLLAQIRCVIREYPVSSLTEIGLSDALLPVVRRYADQRAAEELRAVADAIPHRNLDWMGDLQDAIRDRADALTREATT